MHWNVAVLAFARPHIYVFTLSGSSLNAFVFDSGEPPGLPDGKTGWVCSDSVN
jgi:hypothetical protein